MIFIVDEDVIQMSSLKTEFEIRGYDVTIIDNADDAWNTIININDIEAIIIDVMLAAKPSLSRYDCEKTQDYTITGIVLAEDFLLEYHDKYNGKIIYLSHTNENGLLTEIHKSSKKNTIPFFRKRDYTSDLALAENILNSLSLPTQKS